MTAHARRWLLNVRLAACSLGVLSLVPMVKTGALANFNRRHAPNVPATVARTLLNRSWRYLLKTTIMRLWQTLRRVPRATNWVSPRTAATTTCVPGLFSRRPSIPADPPEPVVFPLKCLHLCTARQLRLPWLMMKSIPLTLGSRAVSRVAPKSASAPLDLAARYMHLFVVIALSC